MLIIRVITIKEVGIGGAYSMQGERIRYDYNILVGKRKGNLQLGRSRCRWKDDTVLKCILRDIRCRLALELSLVDTIMKLKIP
jgi:hypothetical protein